MIKVLVADDHTLVRDGIRALLATASDVQRVAEAADGREAIARATATHPDVILLDIAMPGFGGLEAVPVLRRDVSHLRLRRAPAGKPAGNEQHGAATHRPYSTRPPPQTFAAQPEGRRAGA